MRILPWRRQFRLHGRRSGHPGRMRARYDLIGPPRRFRQHAGHALPPLVMSKFMGLGFTLEQAVAMASIHPAKIINRVPKMGTLQVGAPGDVAIVELVEAPVS